jgi:hypothetical protein
MWHQAFGIEWDKGDRLHYRLDNTWRLDQVLAEAEPSPVEDAKVSLTGVTDGVWSVEWWDTLAGKRLAAAETTASRGVLPLPAPAFQVDIAARLKRH